MKKKAKKTLKTKNKIAKKPKKNAKAAKKPAKKTKAKTSAAKKVSLAELFKLKKQKEALAAAPHADANIPPHELHDKASLRAKPQGNTKIGRSGTVRHH